MTQRTEIGNEQQDEFIQKEARDLFVKLADNKIHLTHASFVMFCMTMGILFNHIGLDKLEKLFELYLEELKQRGI